MQNLSDNELDKHFKDAAEKFLPPFDPEAWQNMQARLDQVANETKPGPFDNPINKAMLLIVIFFMGSVTGILTWKHFSSDTERPNQFAAASLLPGDLSDPSLYESEGKTKDENGAIQDYARAEPENPANNLNKGAPLQRSGSPEPDNKLENYRTQRETDRISGPIGEIAVHPTQSKERVASETENVNGGKQDRTGTSGSDRAPVYLQSSNESSRDKINQTPVNETRREDQEGMPESQDKRHKNLSDPLHDRNDFATRNGADIKTIPDSTSLLPATESTDKKKQQPEEEDDRASRSSWYRFSVIAAVSPDFSSVQFGKQTTPGTNYALLAEYHLSRRFSIQSGAILSNKIYTANDIEYRGYDVSKADGDCRIIDIPINLYYRFGTGSRFSFFTSAGFSSYLMKKENYTFYYQNPYGPDEYSKEVRNENNEWMKVVNFSAGVTKRLTPHFFIEAEPFVKIPLAGVGYGKLNVNTIGLFLRFKYSFIQPN